MTMLGATLAVPAAARAQDSIFDTFARNRVLRNTDREGNTVAALDAIDTVEPILSVDTAHNLQLAIMQYEQIMAAGGWEQMPRDIFGLVAGVDRRSVSRLRDRLIMSGDVPAEQQSKKDIFDEYLDAGLRQFQARHGLLVSGKVDAETFFALNVPADYRLQQLRLNAMRVEAISAELSDRYVVVNIPAATIEAIDAGLVARRHTAVVGRIDRQTPILHSKVHEINFNPYWHVPKSIIRRDLIKYMNEDPNYLANYRIRIFDGGGNELSPTDIDWSTDDAVNYAFRQDPGGENSMGHVKINFYNKHNVYLHDTPTKSLFGENRRFHSSGCVRVEDVDALVAWLLRDNGDWDVTGVEAMFNSGERVDVAIKNPVPIHTTYISAWANRQGTVSFREDVYEYDKAGKVTFDDA
ncbi:L,D-transpeptidase family protein [Mariluticola halotolerans]|uniref:L,D-transpeptidase family protein n=1 Tax=Mariluticola halotolerans TaxID=2909283 RepID=UPI0026E478B5|nr:L,D-transpeptidase family protein [Mariluticola halotolerans]UJQ95654.1 L,D-transpeptidase family protein [Mariluticola halotolerans]